MATIKDKDVLRGKYSVLSTEALMAELAGEKQVLEGFGKGGKKFNNTLARVEIITKVLNSRPEYGQIDVDGRGFPAYGLREKRPIKVPGTDDRGIVDEAEHKIRLLVAEGVSVEYAKVEALRFLLNTNYDVAKFVNDLATEMGLDQEGRWEILNFVNRGIDRAEEFQLESMNTENPVDAWGADVVESGGVKTVREWILEDRSRLGSMDIPENDLHYAKEFVQTNGLPAAKNKLDYLDRLVREYLAKEVTSVKFIENGFGLRIARLGIQMNAIETVIFEKEKVSTEIPDVEVASGQTTFWENAIRRFEEWRSREGEGVSEFIKQYHVEVAAGYEEPEWKLNARRVENVKSPVEYNDDSYVKAEDRNPFGLTEDEMGLAALGYSPSEIRTRRRVNDNERGLFVEAA